jgi:hypothetical protein
MKVRGFNRKLAVCREPSPLALSDATGEAAIGQHIQIGSKTPREIQ